MFFALTSFGKQFTLVIDAGHGGHDAGAVGEFSKEKDINLKVALAFGKYVEKNMPNVKVIYTRKTDVFIPLAERANIANKNHADIFISIHTNSVPKGRTAYGIETYTMGLRRSEEKFSAALRENEVITYEKDYKQRYNGYDPKSPESLIMFELMHDNNMTESVALASHIQKNICAEAGRQSKGVKQDVFLVLRETSMPACLVELGFISTPEEEQFLNSASGIDRLALGIYKGFAKYSNQGSSNIALAGYAPQTTASNSTKPAANQAAKPNAAQAAKPNTAQAAKPNAAQAAKPNAAQAAKPNAAQAAKPAAPAAKPQFDPNAKSTYKVVILWGYAPIKAGDPQFKGRKDVKQFNDNGIIRYTVGGDFTDQQQAFQYRASLLKDFPKAFVCTFQKGVRVK